MNWAADGPERKVLLDNITVGFAVCGSFCTHAKAMAALEQVRARWQNVIPIVSECTAETDTRFGKAHDLMREMERICDHRVIASVKAAEPIGPQHLLDLLIICPCTGNTLGKLANGITDTSVTLAVKAHLRNARPVVLAVSTNDALANAGKNIGSLLNSKNIYFVPMRQDAPEQKPCSIVADFSRLTDTVQSALSARQLQPLFC